MECDQVKFSRHALARMFQRAIAEADVLEVLQHGEVVEDYSEGMPYPGWLLLGWCRGQPLHVVAARDMIGTCIVITTYVPDTALWEEDFKTRRTV